MVLEVAEEAHGGHHKFVEKGFVPKSQIGRFTATANSYKAIGLAARHGKTKGFIDTANMTLIQAREMVRSILEKWAKEIA
jgi:hypothetical protein